MGSTTLSSKPPPRAIRVMSGSKPYKNVANANDVIDRHQTIRAFLAALGVLCVLRINVINSE